MVDERSREGDWELNTIIGKNNKQAIVSINQRVHRLIYLYKVGTKDAESVADAITRTLKEKGLPVLTLTADNGREFGNHQAIAKSSMRTSTLPTPIAPGKGEQTKTLMDWLDSISQKVQTSARSLTLTYEELKESLITDHVSVLI